MMDVGELIPSKKFTFEGGLSWGLMVRKWEIHRGRVDLQVLAKFIEDMEHWQEKKEENSTSSAVATDPGIIAHGDVGTSSTTVTRPPTATTTSPETKPVLQNYVTDAEGGANIWQLMEHPYIWKARPPILPTANGPKAYGPWAEAWEENLPPEQNGAGSQEGDTADSTSPPAEGLANSVWARKIWDLGQSARERWAADLAHSQGAGSSQEVDDCSTDAGGINGEGFREAESIHKKRGGHGSSGDERSAKRTKTTDGDDAEPEVELEGEGRVVASEQQRDERP
jgi:hypothetical protein